LEPVGTNYGTTEGVELMAAQGGMGSDTNLWNGILEVRGHFQFGDRNWSVPYYFDVGAEFRF